MIWVAVFILIVLFMIFVTKSSSKYDSSGIKVYGSMGCSWTVKQLDYLKDKSKKYEFIDCSTGTCPDFVKGFPTSVVNGKTIIGYNEY